MEQLKQRLQRGMITVFIGMVICMQGAYCGTLSSVEEPVAKPIEQAWVFDMQGVLFDTNYPEAVKSGIASLPRIVALLVQYISTYPTSLRAWKSALAILASCQTPRSETWKAIQELKEAHKDVALYIFSNITPSAYELLVKQYPDFMNLFECAFTPSEENHWEKKTTAALCETVEQRISEDFQKKGIELKGQILFEDTAANIDFMQSRNTGWKGVHVLSDEECAQKIRSLI